MAAACSGCSCRLVKLHVLPDGFSDFHGHFMSIVIRTMNYFHAISNIFEYRTTTRQSLISQ